MRAHRIVLAAAVSAAVLFARPAIGGAQSLADIARQEAERRKRDTEDDTARRLLVNVATNAPGARKAIIEAGRSGDLRDEQLRALLGAGCISWLPSRG